MSLRESNAFKRLKARVCRPDDRFERVENGLASGWPDSNYCFAGCEGWIEIKAPQVPARDNSPVLSATEPLSLEQSNWALKQVRAQGRVFVFVATDVRLFMIDGLFMVEYKKLNAMSMEGLTKAACWHVDVPVADQVCWVELRGVLCAKPRPYFGG